MKTFLNKWLVLVLALGFSINMAAQFDEDFLEWNFVGVEGIYEEIAVEDTSSYSAEIAVINESDSTVRYFVKSLYVDGTYYVTVNDEVNSRFWGMVGSSHFIYFRSNPFLFSMDEGVLVWDGISGNFYKHP